MERLPRPLLGVIALTLAGWGSEFGQSWLQVSGYRDTTAQWLGGLSLLCFLSAIGILLYAFAWPLAQRVRIRIVPEGPPATGRGEETVVIRIPSMPNRSIEPSIEWVHLEAEAQRSIARDTLVWMHIGDQRYDLRWPGDEGPQETRSLHPGRPVAFPLVARYLSEDSTAIRGLGRGALRSNICHVTDDQFLIRSVSTAILVPNREYRLDVTIQYNDSERATRSFWLFVSNPGAGPITLRNA